MWSSLVVSDNFIWCTRYQVSLASTKFLEHGLIRHGHYYVIVLPMNDISLSIWVTFKPSISISWFTANGIPYFEIFFELILFASTVFRVSHFMKNIFKLSTAIFLRFSYQSLHFSAQTALLFIIFIESHNYGNKHCTCKVTKINQLRWKVSPISLKW